MRRAYADTKWGQIHYRFDGEGDVLLLLHQTPSSSVMYERAIPIFARSYRVIAMDTLGYGQSDRPSGPMEIPAYAQCVADFLDVLDIERVSVVGHHTGSAVGVELAVSHPERVTKLVINGAPYWEPEEQAQLLQFHALPVELKEDGSHLMYWWNRIKKKNPNAGLDLWQTNLVQTLKAGDYYNVAFNTVFRYDLGRRLPLLKCPTLVMCGDQDMFYKHVRVVLALTPQAREVIIRGTGGAIVHEKTEEFTGAVLDFLENPGV